MNPQNEDHDNTDDTTDAVPTDRRPLAYWLRAVDALLTREFADAFEREGVTRREWMLLNALSGDVDAPGLAERLARKGKRLRGLESRGWAEEQGDGTWSLTDAGRDARARLGETVDGIRSRAVAAAGDEAFATTMASLEAIAREFGWDESAPRPFGPRGGRGFRGPRPFRPEIRHGFGPNLHRGFAPGRPGDPGTDPRGIDSVEARHGHPSEGCRHPGAHHGHHGHHGHHIHGEHGADHGHHGEHRHHGGRRAERAFERGFAAGFAASDSRGPSAA